MTDLQRPIRQARRRLWLNRWLQMLGWALTGAAGFFVLAVLAQRSLVLIEEPSVFLGIAAGALTGSALIASVIWLAVTGESRNEAAVRLDEAAGLKERLSSGLYCASLTDPFAQAVVADARRITKDLQAGRHLPIQFPRSSNYAAGSLLAALLTLWLFPTLDLMGSQSQRAQQRQQADALNKSQVHVKAVLQETLTEISDKNPTLKEELENLEPIQAAPLQTPLDVRRQALKKVEKVGEQLDKKRNSSKLAQVNEFKKMMRALTNQPKNNSPTSKLSQALAKGDMKSAQDALTAMQKQLAANPQNEELKQQLKQLANKLNQIAQNDKKLRDKLSEAGLSKEELEKALKNLKNKDFEAVAKQLANKGLSAQQINQTMQLLKKRCRACSSAGCLASSLMQAANSGSMAVLSNAAQQLSALQNMELQLMQLEAAMNELDSAKEQLTLVCKNCNGTGMCNGNCCSVCQGSGMCNKTGRSMCKGTGRGGRGAGMGHTQGSTITPSTSPYQTVTRRDSVKEGAGQIIMQRFVNGEQFKGEVSREFAETVISAQRDATDAIAREQIPRLYHSSIQKYFTRSQRSLPDDKDHTDNKAQQQDQPGG